MQAGRAMKLGLPLPTMETGFLPMFAISSGSPSSRHGQPLPLTTVNPLTLVWDWASLLQKRCWKGPVPTSNLRIGQSLRLAPS